MDERNQGNRSAGKNSDYQETSRLPRDRADLLDESQEFISEVPPVADRVSEKEDRRHDVDGYVGVDGKHMEPHQSPLEVREDYDVELDLAADEVFEGDNERQ